MAGIAAATPEWTIVDCAETGTQPEQVELAIRQALQRPDSGPRALGARERHVHDVGDDVDHVTGPGALSLETTAWAGSSGSHAATTFPRGMVGSGAAGRCRGPRVRTARQGGALAQRAAVHARLDRLAGGEVTGLDLRDAVELVVVDVMHEGEPAPHAHDVRHFQRARITHGSQRDWRRQQADPAGRPFPAHRS